MNTSEQTEALYKALSQAQGEFPTVVKDAKNPFFKSTYATLGACIQAVQPALTKHGLSISAGANPVGGAPDYLGVTVRLQHESGQWQEIVSVAKPKDTSPQGIGSCITYLRRYGICSLLNLATDDDDGNASSKPNATPQEPKVAPPKGVAAAEYERRRKLTDEIIAYKRELNINPKHWINAIAKYTDGKYTTACFGAHQIPSAILSVIKKKMEDKRAGK